MATDRQKLGTRGEELAEALLLRQGYTLVARNYRCPYGEVDRVMDDRGTLVFVEVKTRRGVGFGPPAENITAFKRRQITRTALNFLQEHESWGESPCRFDAVEVLLVDGAPPEVRHLPGVFEAEACEE